MGMVPDVGALVAANSNHWRKILNLLAKVACPVAEDWRRYRDQVLFQETALCFAPVLAQGPCWHWIGGKENLLRFTGLRHCARPLHGAAEIAVDPQRRLLLTPYPDYRQLSNARVEQVRRILRSTISTQVWHEAALFSGVPAVAASCLGWTSACWQQPFGAL